MEVRFLEKLLIYYDIKGESVEGKKRMFGFVMFNDLSIVRNCNCLLAYPYSGRG